MPAALRKKVFARARVTGIHAFTGAMLGFGGMVAGASPGGLPLELVSGIEDAAITGSRLPEGLREIFVPEHLDRLEKYLHLHRAPSIAISPALLGTLLSVEAAVALLGNTVDGWRPPVCLPHLLLVDLLRMNFKVVHLNELILKQSLASRGGTSRPGGSEIGSTKVEVSGSADRLLILAMAGFNTNLIPHEAVKIDLLTDSWSEIPGSAHPEPAVVDSSWTAASVEQGIEGLFGYKYIVPVFRGRFAEALLCKAIAAPGSVIVSNALFPTTRFHLESNGFSLREMIREEAYDSTSDHPFKGDLDIEEVKGNFDEGKGIGAFYIELCVNALGGHPVSLENLSEIHQFARGRGIPVLLDLSRAFENAVLMRQRDIALSDRSLVSIVRQLCALSDACAASCTKDFRSPCGGFVGMNEDALYTRVLDLTLAFGNGLEDASRKELLAALSASPESPIGPKGRVEQVQRLWNALRHRGVPVVAPCGGHGVFVDARSMLPQVPPDKFPVETLANELFLAGGVRAAPNFGSAGQRERGIHLLRLAVPTGGYTDEKLNGVVEAFEQVLANRERARGLDRISVPAGAIGEYAAEFRQIRA